MITKRKISTLQSSMDATLLTYGRQDAFFNIHNQNVDLVIDNSSPVPEVAIPALFETKDLIFDTSDVLYDVNVARSYSRENSEVATLDHYDLIGDDNISRGSFSKSFSKSFSI